jgi:hypothetical protein
MLIVVVMPLIVVGCVVAGVVLSALYFGAGFMLDGWIHGHALNDAFARGVGDKAGRLAFTFGAPAGALMGFLLAGPIAEACVDRGLAKDGRFVAWLAIGITFALSATIFIVPLYFSLFDNLKLLGGSMVKVLLGFGYVWLVERMMTATDALSCMMAATEVLFAAKAADDAAPRGELTERK